MAVDAGASAAVGRDITIAVDEEVAVAAEPSIEVDKEVAEGLAAAAKLADLELVVSSVNHAERLACAAVAEAAASLAKLRAVEPDIVHLEGVVANGGTFQWPTIRKVAISGLLGVTCLTAKKWGGSLALRRRRTLENVRGNFNDAVAEVVERARYQVIGYDYDLRERAFEEALNAAETRAEKLAMILAQSRLLYACSVTANLSDDSPARVLSLNFSSVLSQKRVGVLAEAARAVGIEGRLDRGTVLKRLDLVIRLVEGKLAEEPADDRAMASVNRFGACLSVVDAPLEAELFARFVAAWRPFASRPGHGPVGHVPFDAAERDRLRAVVKSYQGKPANPIGHVRFGVPLESGSLPGLSPPRGSSYLVPVDALSRRSIEHYAASLAKSEKKKPHLYLK